MRFSSGVILFFARMTCTTHRYASLPGSDDDGEGCDLADAGGAPVGAATDGAGAGVGAALAFCGGFVCFFFGDIFLAFLGLSSMWGCLYSVHHHHQHGLMYIGQQHTQVHLFM